MLYPGTLNWHQGVDIAIKAFGLIKDQIPGAEFHIYGEGSEKECLKKLVSELGLQGMINDLVKRSDYAIGEVLNGELELLTEKKPGAIARVISSAENFPEVAKETLEAIHQINKNSKTPVLGITGTGGAGKSSLVDELVRRFLIDFPEKTIGSCLWSTMPLEKLGNNDNSASSFSGNGASSVTSK